MTNDLKNMILRRDENDTLPVDLPGWPDGLYLRRLSGHDIDQVAIDGESESDVVKTVRMVALALVDATGNPVFDARSNEDLEALKALPFVKLTAITQLVIEHNGLSESIEDTKKN